MGIESIEKRITTGIGLTEHARTDLRLLLDVAKAARYAREQEAAGWPGHSGLKRTWDALDALEESE